LSVNDAQTNSANNWLRIGEKHDMNRGENKDRLFQGGGKDNLAVTAERTESKSSWRSAFNCLFLSKYLLDLSELILQWVLVLKQSIQ